MMNSLLSQYINQGGLSPTEKLLSRCYPFLGMRKAAPLIDEYGVFNDVVDDKKLLKVPPYLGNNRAVLGAKEFFNRSLNDDIYAVLLHGSLATNDEMNYSDFDALVVIKDEVFADASRLNAVCKKLNGAQRYLRWQDALQHHGWMVLGQKALLHYDRNYLPIETLERSKSILGDAPVEIEYQLGTPSDINKSFLAICNSVKSKLTNPRMKQSAYFLKATLSELMLLPALWYQATQEKGIYKGDSFSRVSSAFSENEWKAIEIASMIRNKWPEYSNSWVTTLNGFNPVLASWVAKRRRWPISNDILELMTPLFFTSVEAFLSRCKKEVAQC